MLPRVFATHAIMSSSLPITSGGIALPEKTRLDQYALSWLGLGTVWKLGIFFQENGAYLLGSKAGSWSRLVGNYGDFSKHGTCKQAC